jgi:hypothetical protein
MIIQHYGFWYKIIDKWFHKIGDPYFCYTIDFNLKIYKNNHAEEEFSNIHTVSFQWYKNKYGVEKYEAGNDYGVPDSITYYGNKSSFVYLKNDTLQIFDKFQKSSVHNYKINKIISGR